MRLQVILSNSIPILGIIVGTRADFEAESSAFCCGQSYKAPTIVIYDSRVAPDSKIPHITKLES